MVLLMFFEPLFFRQVLSFHTMQLEPPKTKQCRRTKTTNINQRTTVEHNASNHKATHHNGPPQDTPPHQMTQHGNTQHNKA